MQYQLIYIIWLISFVPDSKLLWVGKTNVLLGLRECARNAIKEKVVRMVIATFRNLISKSSFSDSNGENVLRSMVGLKIYPVIELLGVRKWSDGDIIDDLEFVRDTLSKKIAQLSTFDEYESEVRAGKLEWSPPHLSDAFWSGNAARLDENNHELVRYSCFVIEGFWWVLLSPPKISLVLR